MAVVDGVILGFGCAGCGGGEVDVFEERAGGRSGGGVGKFGGANGGDDGTDRLWGEVGEAVGLDIVFDGIVEGARYLASVESKGNRDDEIAALMSGIKGGTTVGEAKVGTSESLELV